VNRLAEVLAVGIAAAAAVAGCKQKRDYNGIGSWDFSRTRLSQATGRCLPSDLPDGRKGSWCFGQPPAKIAGSVADLDLFFDGEAADARLIEIQLKVRGCNETRLETWMRQSFGAVAESRSTRAYWKTGSMYALAEMPSEPGRCLVRLFPSSEATEFKRVWATP
jgi:hypothetical protein